MSPLTIQAPPGFSYVPDFLLSDECQRLDAYVRSLRMKHDVFRCQVMRRGSHNFGFDYVAIGQQVVPAPPFSEPIRDLAARAAALCEGIPLFDECSVTHYPVGAGIGWHTDASSFADVIAGISLAGAGRFQFRRKGETKPGYELLLGPGSLYVMQGSARWDYQHRVVPVKSARYSITFRTVRQSGGAQ